VNGVRSVETKWAEPKRMRAKLDLKEVAVARFLSSLELFGMWSACVTFRKAQVVHYRA
jgi:hypothetical protein